ncbi:MAG TPA: ATP-binding protein [Ktedonobacteraceae bacterium]|nr:ATP-binding protein [Ktedonobacteraceae bacterium]
MRVSWWRSIRWRLALGSILVSLLATTLLAITVLVAVNYYYGVDLRQRLVTFAGDTAQRLGVSYTQNGTLAKAVTNVLPQTPTQSAQDQEFLLLVFNTNRQLLYPHFGTGKNPPGPGIAALIIASNDPSLKQGDYTYLLTAIASARQGTPTTGEIGQASPGGSSSLFVAQPIYANGQTNATIVGVLVAVPRTSAQSTTPTFLATITWFILIAAIIVAVLATLVALLFSRTITRPLAKLTNTAHVLASGDYSARVQTNARSELGELADTVNLMASRLERDMEELRRQENERRELIMNITHDLATPLTAIAGLGESLVDGVNQSHEDYEKTGRVIVRETLRLRRLVRDLHIMAKLEAGAMQPKRKPLRLAALVDESLAVLAPEFERANVEPLNNISYTLPVLWADPDMLMRVFSNLCDNALRHTPSGGTVTVEARQQGDMIEVAVTDSGKGIPPDALPRIFDRFFRADNSRQISTGGSGLGLAIVRAIVEAHGGSARAENAPQGGARIIFSLPIPVLNQEQMAGITTMPFR